MSQIKNSSQSFGVHRELKNISKKIAPVPLFYKAIELGLIFRSKSSVDSVPSVRNLQVLKKPGFELLVVVFHWNCFVFELHYFFEAVRDDWR